MAKYTNVDCIGAYEISIGPKRRARVSINLVQRCFRECLPPGQLAFGVLPIALVDPITVRLTLAFLFLACGSGFGLASTITHLAIVDAVNAKLPPHERFEHLGGGPMKSYRLHREYRRLYPGGTLLRRAGILTYIALFSLVVTATLLGVGALGIVWVGGVGALGLWFLHFRNRPLSNKN